MCREELVDLGAFLPVVEEQSFTRAPAKLGTTQSALSYRLRRLQARLGTVLSRADLSLLRRSPRFTP